MSTDSLSSDPASMGNELMQLVTTNILSMWSSIIAMLPSMVGALILLIFGYVLARIVRFMLVKSMTTIGVDKLGAQIASSFGGEGVTFSISAVIGKIVFWLIMVSFFIMATDILGMMKKLTPSKH